MPSPGESPASPQYGTTPFTTFASLVMLLVVLLLVSKAGAVCVGGPQELRTGEVLVMCPLSEDVRLTRRAVVISHSNHDQPIPDIMLGCDWLARDSHTADCRSHFNFTLASLHKDCVMARVPRAQLHKNGSYQCELVPPPDADHAFSRCLVYDNDDTEDPTTTLSPVIPAADQTWPRDPMEKVLTDGHPRDNSVSAVGLTLAGVGLLVLIVVLVAFMILRHRRHRRTVLQTSETFLEKEQQPIRTVSQTSENSLEKEQRPIEYRRIAQRLSEIAWEMKQQSRSATPERGRSRERPSPKELTGEQPRREVPEPTNLPETKALLKMEQDKC